MQKLIFLITFMLPTLLLATTWPKMLITPNGGRLTLYQPELEKFNGVDVSARMPVSYKPEGKEEIYGIIWTESRVIIDRNNKLVKIKDIQITKAKYPNATDEKTEKVEKFLNDQLAENGMLISLERFRNSIAIIEDLPIVKDKMSIDVPLIKTVFKDAVQIVIDGEPLLKEVKNTDLMLVQNSPFFIAFVKNEYFFLGGGFAYKTLSLNASWSMVQKEELPNQVLETYKQYNKGKNYIFEEGKAPEIICTTKPGILVSIKGEPELAPISRPSLFYVVNTTSDLFKDADKSQWYLLNSGRWFKTKDLQNGPWTLVQPDALPQTFANISNTSAKKHVLSNVSGTVQAREAIADQVIPQTATIKREHNPKLTIIYDGEPKFKDIPGTDMEYCINTKDALFKIENKYYLCKNAIWLVADDTKGPWDYALKVPPEILKIPPTNPHYNVKYVYIYDYDPEVIYVGYTPGYQYSYYYSGTVVYNTGYYYPYWYGVYYWGWPSCYIHSATYHPKLGVWTIEAGYWGHRTIWFKPYNEPNIVQRTYWAYQYNKMSDNRQDNINKIIDNRYDTINRIIDNRQEAIDKWKGRDNHRINNRDELVQKFKDKNL